MDVRLSEEQRALRDAAAQVVDRLGPKAVAQIGEPERGARLHAAVTGSGWRELRVGADGGGPLASGVEAAIVAEELGRGAADVSFLGPTLAAELRRLAGAPPSSSVETVALDTRLSSLVGGVGGDWPAAVAIDTQGSALALVLTPVGEGSRLAGVALRAAPSGLDLTRPSEVLDPCPPATMVEGADRALTGDDLTRWTALGLSLSCADLVGTMRGAVELACAYAAQRRQYGAAIGSFQAVQHMLADAFVATEGSRSVTLHAAWAVDALPAGEALAAAAVAKAYCGRAARTVCETGIQVHGGIGNTWECLAHVYLRRALLSADLLGDALASLAHVLAHRGIGGTDGLR
ncbi:MAG TPA: acyl-CoA dehydrogenase [Acidimicrobiales bacterium]|nr:acyl-CoA dehydrogenase [Acidimicrobiales bacterium]